MPTMLVGLLRSAKLNYQQPYTLSKLDVVCQHSLQVWQVGSAVF